jgi:hypothetical protein
MYEDEHGNNCKLCSKHARDVGSHKVQNPCRDCPEGEKKEAHYKDENGNNKKLCSEHAKAVGSHQPVNPCRDCPEGETKEAMYEDEHGNKCKLCSKHAKLSGSHKVLHPCRDCPEGEKKASSYPDENGNNCKLCVSHAHKAGTVIEQPKNVSKAACEAFDYLERVRGIKLQHVHLVGDGSTCGVEFKVPDSNFRVDAVDWENGVIYEYLGNHVHGYPPEHPLFNEYSGFIKDTPNRELYESTMERLMLVSKLTSMRVVYIWAHMWAEVTRSKLPKPCSFACLSI